MTKKITIIMTILVLLCVYVPASRAAISPEARASTNQWKADNGYTFPIYGATTADLSPISDFLAILAENNILLTLPELQISQKEDYDWVSADIENYFWLLYRPYHDGTRYIFSLELPYTYLPMNEAFPLMLVSTLSMEISEAEELYATLIYNVIDGSCEYITDDYTVTYLAPRLKNGNLASFAALEVEKQLPE